MNNTNNSDEQDFKPIPPYAYYETTQQMKIHHFYLSEAVGAPNEYVEMIHIIMNAGPSDLIYIHLNTPGGRIDTGVQIVNALRSTQAKVITSLESEAHSLGTLIFLSGDEFVVHDDCLMMFHNYSGGIMGKGNEQVAQLEATVKWFNKLAKRIYIPFLSEEEFEKIIRGEDLWLDSDEIKERLQVMIDHLIAERELEEDEEEEEESEPLEMEVITPKKSTPKKSRQPTNPPKSK